MHKKKRLNPAYYKTFINIKFPGIGLEQWAY